MYITCIATKILYIKTKTVQWNKEKVQYYLMISQTHKSIKHHGRKFTPNVNF